MSNTSRSQVQQVEPDKADLREEAEQQISESTPEPPKALERGTDRLLHELQVYQVELEIQNEELRKSQVEIEESRDTYAVLFELSPNPYLRLDSQLKIINVNRAAIALLKPSSEELIGASFTRWVSAKDADQFYLHCQQVRRWRKKQTCELELNLDNGRMHTVQVSSVVLEPSEASEVSFLISIADLTAREKERAAFTEEHARLELRVAERTRELASANLVLKQYSAELKKLTRAVDQSRSLIILTDANGMIEYTNPRFTQLTGIPAAKVIGQPASLETLRFAPEGDFEEIWETLHTDTEWRGTIESRNATGEKSWRELCVSSIANDSGITTNYLMVGEDVTERKIAAERQQLLLAELNHRVKNTLCVVLSIAKQTVRTNTDLAKFREAFEGRLMALAQLHRLLTNNDWGSIALEDLVKSATKPYIDDAGPTVVIDGPMVKLEPMDAQSLHFVLHELATNAAKYGAFSVLNGTVKVHWKRTPTGADATTIALTWTESGGPEITPAKKKGFGYELIERTIASGMNGTAEVHYPPSGLSWKMKISVQTDGRISTSDTQNQEESGHVRY